MGCGQSGKQYAEDTDGHSSVGAPRPGPKLAKGDAAWDPSSSMTSESKLAKSWEAGRRKGSTSSEGGVRSRASADWSTSSSMSLGHMNVRHVGTKVSCMSMDSQLLFANPNQTIIIFDWDDTLCPSTFLQRFRKFDSNGRLTARLDSEILSELNMLADQVLTLLRCSMTMGKVVIVTNARRPWVDVSCSNFLPALKAWLKDIPVIYAMELIEGEKAEAANAGRYDNCLLTETKARAMQEVVSQFYSRYKSQSWKNIVSIGDALFEHAAIRQVVNERPTQKQRCRTKTVKLLDAPTIAGMVVQLSIVGNWLNKIIQADTDVDIDLSANEETMDRYVSLYGAPRHN